MLKKYHPQNLKNLTIVNVPCDALTANPYNARTHSPKQLKRLTESFESFGCNMPILANRDGKIIAGHARAEVARRLGYKEVPVIYIDHLSEDEQRAFMIADNKLTELGGWDLEILAIELQHLTMQTDIDVSVTGFEVPEADFIIQKKHDATLQEEKISEPCHHIVSESGDFWQLGKHQILCASALHEASYERLMHGDLAQMVFTDPPYNVPIVGHVSGLGRNHHDEFLMASGEMLPEEFVRFLRCGMALLVAYSADGSIHFVCMDWRHIHDLLNASAGLYSELKNLCVWNKDNGGMGSLYRSKHELIFVFKNGIAPHINNVELGKHGRYRTNVWDYPGQNAWHGNRAEELAMHPTVKPLALVQDALLDCSKRGGIILDPFGGSGTTLIAAEKTGRRARLLEIDPRYVDVTIRRWQMLTGEKAIHVTTGVSFDEMETFVDALGGSNG